MSPIDILETVAMIWLFVSLVGIAGLLVWAILTSMSAPEEEHQVRQGAPTVPFTTRYPLPDVEPRPLEVSEQQDVEMTDTHIARRLEVVRRQNQNEGLQ